MRRIPLPIVLGLLACLAFALTACSFAEPRDPSEATDAARAILERLEEERAAMSAEVDLVEARLAEIQAHAASDGEVATIAANLRAKVDEGRALLERLDEGIEAAEARLNEAPVYDDTGAQHLANAAAVAQGVGSVLPPPFGEIAGLLGVGLGVAASVRARAKAKLATETVSDALAGFDRWFDRQQTAGDAARAREAWTSIQGAMSEKTKAFVRANAAYPVE